MPFPMHLIIQAVLVEGKVFIGGGFTDPENEQVVMAYDIRSGRWATLPLYGLCWFSLTAVKNQLVLVGGASRKFHGASKALGVWSSDSNTWTSPYPDMFATRHSCSTAVYKHWLIVAGGRGVGWMVQSSIEVLNTDTKQWFAAPPTPVAWDDMVTAVLGEVCYFMGGITAYQGRNTSLNNVYSLSLPTLVSNLNPDYRSVKKCPEMWKKISQLPVAHAAPVSINGSLCAVGGVDKDDKAVSAIHLYQPDINQWVKVADMPTGRCDCTCVMITDIELLVAGGRGKNQLATVDIAQIC